MPVLLQGSCHCGAVRFTVESHTPVPYQVRRLRSSCVRDSHSHQLCVCSICRKVGGVGGSINLGAQAETLQITQGEEHVRCVLHTHAHTHTPSRLLKRSTTDPLSFQRLPRRARPRHPQRIDRLVRAQLLLSLLCHAVVVR